MKTVVSLIFMLELALLFTHEMDAIRRKEWRMFIVLKDMADEKAYWLFTLLHIPLFIILLFLLSSHFRLIGFYITDIFLIGHSLVHIGFRRHPANGFNNWVSALIIHMAGVLAILHLAVF